jgi:hypothetical protein
MNQNFTFLSWQKVDLVTNLRDQKDQLVQKHLYIFPLDLTAHTVG